MKLLKRFRKAAALPFVLLLVALNVIVVVALLVYATTELHASRNSGQAEVARALAQSGIDIAASLIAANSTDNGFVSYQRIVTNVSGETNPRLETKIANVAAIDTTMPWNKSIVNPSALLHSGFAAGTSGVDLNFGVGTNTDAGFIAPRTNLSGWTNLSANMFRMDWIYVYKGDASKPGNLVGRIAYWVDDESSKLNINYSGTTEVYGTAFDNGQGIPYTLIRVNSAGNSTSTFGNLNGRTWPLDTELGGVAGLSISNVKSSISWRHRPDGINFNPFPSVLGLRIGTSGDTTGPAITTLFQQAALGLTATAYSSEPERSYISGRKRYDISQVRENAPLSTITNMQNAIISEYPAFDAKYDIHAFARSTYSLVQAITVPANTFDATDRLYVRGLPVANEIDITASLNENIVEVKASVELVLLGPSTEYGSYNWGKYIKDSSKFTANVTLLPENGENVLFGGLTQKVITTDTTTSWFTQRGTDYGPNTTNLSGCFGVLSKASSLNSTSGEWSFPSSVRVDLYYNNSPYQSFTFSPAKPGNCTVSLPAGSARVIYALVAQPKKSEGLRGDPRFGIFESDVKADTSTGFPYNYVHPLSSLKALNPVNWDINTFGSPDYPDLTSDLIFFEADSGIPNYSGNKDCGIGNIIAGIGWLGEVPVIKPTGGNQLAWSTPRFWGDGRESSNAPPDWLLLDIFHMGMFQPDSNGTFLSRGRVNVNSAKSFFQPIAGSTIKADTIMDSVIIGAGTKDFRTSVYGDTGWKTIDGRQTFRTNVLQQIKTMTEARCSSNNPYTTHFEFLAKLAAADINGSTAPAGIWMGPKPNSGNIYTATNTTDRRIEGVVRSLNQKFTTHGNQFSIFSLAQALQPSSTGTVSIPGPNGTTNKANVVGEAYLQAVYERAPEYNESTGAITNGSATGAPPMRQLYLRELRY